MNVLTFDIEEWYLEKVKGGDYDDKCRTFDRILSEILDMLDVKKEKATFFCVGKMGCEFPNVVRKIYERGHEIGCHSNVHTWLNKMTEGECRQDTCEAIDSLEQCIGEKIRSYRAPAFSIGENNKWAFEILAELGIERDSSVYPSTRDFGGFPNFGSNSPSLISYNGITLKEYPISMTTIMGKRMAYSGGGYFRFFPLWFVSRQMKNSDYNMLYFHIEDILAESSRPMSKADYEAYFKEKGTVLARYKRFVKANLGKKKAYEKLQKLITMDEYVNLKQADSLVDWHTVAHVSL